MARIEVNGASIQSLYLEPTFLSRPLGGATGFVVSVVGPGRPTKHYLVTNWHVLAGRRSDDHTIMDKVGSATPDKVTIHHNVQGVIGSWKPVVEALRDEDDRPLWLEHPAFGSQVDVGVLPLTRLDGVNVAHHDLNEGSDIVVEVTTDVSVVGFPFGVRHAGGFGIWTRGTIATEFEVDFDGMPCFLIDARTREGQSGSPVLYWDIRNQTRRNGDSFHITQGAQARFLGIYSGRIRDDSDLGRVWRPSAILQVINGRTPDVL